jgi:hypothetical protein
MTHRDTSILPSKSNQREINLLTPQLPSTSTTTRRSRSFVNTNCEDETPPLSPTDSITTSQESSRPPTPVYHYFPPRLGSIYTMANHVINPPKGLYNDGREVESVIQSTNPVLEIEEDSILAVARLERYALFSS